MSVRVKAQNRAYFFLNSIGMRTIKMIDGTSLHKKPLSVKRKKGRGSALG
jgi:hypothetical protein